MTKPTTPAGHELLDALPLEDWHPINRDIVIEHILAIEEQARAEGRREAVREIREHFRNDAPTAVTTTRTIHRILDAVARHGRSSDATEKQR